MGIIIILFLIATILAILIISYRAWEIDTLRIDPSIPKRNLLPKIYFRHLEKIMLHLIKHIIQWIILVAVKGWFIFVTKVNKWALKNLPKICNFFKRKKGGANDCPKKLTFVKRAVIESKIKIKRVKEKIRKDHEEKSLISK